MESKEIGARLMALYGLRFGGQRTGRFRILRKYLRELTRRRRLLERLPWELADEVFERGHVFVDLEAYSVVLGQSFFGGYGRVTGNAIAGSSILKFEDLDQISETLQSTSDEDDA